MSGADGETVHAQSPTDLAEDREDAIEADLERGLDPSLDPNLDPEVEYERFVWKNLRRNYIANYLHGMLGMTGFRLINAPTFLPVYLSLITGSPFLTGLGLGLQQLGGVVSPVVGANFIEHRKRVMPTAMWLGTGMRLPVLLMAAAGWLLKGQPLIIAMLALLFLFGLFGGAQRVVFQLLMAKVIPIQRRGRLQAWRNTTGGAIAAVLAYAAGRYLIKGNAFGNGYATTFLLAFVLTSLGLTAFQLLIREPDPPKVRPRMRVSDRLRGLPALLRSDRGFAYFMLAQTCAVAGRIAAPFYILYAGATLHSLSGATLGIFGLANLGADTASNLLWGYLGDKSGFRSSFLIALLFWIGGTVLLMLSHTMPAFFLAFAFLGAASSGYQMSSQTMVLEFGLREDMAMRLAFSSTAEGVMSSLGPLIGGLIAAAAGYLMVFYTSIGFEVVALAIVVFVVEEPRKRRLLGALTPP